MTNISNSDPNSLNMSSGHMNRLAAARILVGSQLPSDVRRGLVQLRSLLNENNEDLDVYELLLLAANNNPPYREEVHSLIQEYKRRGSRAAGVMMQEFARQGTPLNAESIPINGAISASEKPQNLIDDADDAYYAAEFERAIQLYRQVLHKEPANQRARQQLDKAELNLLSKKSGQKLPREAMQYYRRARSYIAARDVKSAISMLNAAIEEAQSQGKSFPEAEDLLASQHNLEVAAEIKQAAENFIASAHWEQAAERYEQTLNLDPNDELVREQQRKIKDLLEAEALFLSLAKPIELGDRKEKLDKIDKTLKMVEGTYKIANSQRFNILLIKQLIYKAEYNFQVSRFKGSAKGQLTQALSAAHGVLAPDDPVVVYATGQLAKNGRASFPFWILLIIPLVFVGISLGGWRIITNLVSKTPTSTMTTMTLTPSLLLSLTPTLTKSALITSSSTQTIMPSIVFTLSPTPSLTTSSTAQAVQETAYVTNITVAHYFDEPNGRWLGKLTRNQIVTVLDKKVVSGSSWYLCKWEKEGSPIQGWILGTFLSFNPTPTITPTPTN